MNEIEKLRVLLPHWIEHNKGHKTDCSKWTEVARAEGKEKVAEYIDSAMRAMDEVNDLLGKALHEVGGAEDNHHEHHHHHHHHHD